MSDQLINLTEIGIEEPKEIAELSQASGDYLPSLRVFGSSSAIVKQGKFSQGHWGLYYSADKTLDLGTEVDVLIIAKRARASIMMAEEQPINFFDPESANFTAVKEKAKAKIDGHMFGWEYFIWIPSIEQFAQFFMGNPTLRRESANTLGFLGRAATLKIKFIPSKKYGGWHGCETLSCDAPFEIPENEKIKNVYDSKFANPTDSEVAIATADASASERAR